MEHQKLWIRWRRISYASSPSANLLAISISSDTVMGLGLPISSTRSDRRSPSAKASIARSSEIFSAEFFIMLQCYMYERSVSPLFCTQDFTSFIEVGRVYVDRKFYLNYFSSSPQLLMESSVTCLTKTVLHR
jgi:hypothetical protein